MLTVSVVIPCFNAGSTIARALGSVRRQSMAPAEIIVVDDASTDDSVQKIEALRASLAPINLNLVCSDINRGAAFARNIGWDQAKTDLIAFLDADDSWHPRKLETQSVWLQQHPGTVLCGHAYEVCTEDMQTHHTEDNTAAFDSIEYFSFSDFLIRNRLSTPTVMVRRDIDERFCSHKRYCEDYDLWLRITHRYGPCAYSGTALSYLHKQPWGVSGLSADLWAMYRAELDCYVECQRRNWLGRVSLTGLSALSTLKLIRRAFKKLLPFGRL
jgi:glycosyltransferase involved in cell wall biosynthesis